MSSNDWAQVMAQHPSLGTEDPWNPRWTTDSAPARTRTRTDGKLPVRVRSGRCPSKESRSRSPPPWGRAFRDDGGDDPWAGWNGGNRGEGSPGWGTARAGHDHAVEDTTTWPDPDPWTPGAEMTGGGDADSAMRAGEAGPAVPPSLVGGLHGARDGARPGDHEEGEASKGDYGQRCESPELRESEPPAGHERQVSNGNDMQSSKVRGLVEKHHGVKFTALPRYPIDLSRLEDLFPGTRPSSVQPESLPRAVVHDTFTSVERKAWNRISRFGSISEHERGGEARVRVSWKDSHTRKGVLATVRRWMEEDSLGGRVLLGRRLGRAGAAMFNWDSAAPGVQIGELLCRKRGQSHTRHAPAAPRIQIQDTATSPAAPTGSSSERHAGPSPSTTICSHGAPPHSQRLSEPASSSDDEDGGEDQDDWGEMVSSPAVDTGTLLRDASNGFAHRRPSSVDAACATPRLGHGCAGLASPSPEFSTSLSGRAFDPSTGHDGSAVDSHPCHGLGVSKDEPVTWTVDENTPRKPMNPAATITGGLPTCPTMGAVRSHPFALPTPVDIHDRRDDEIVESVLRGLPNLSYMLR